MSSGKMDEAAEPIEKKDAETVARSFNMVVNTLNLYGGDHPSVVKAAENVGDNVNHAMRENPLLTLLRTRDSLYVEGHCVDDVVRSDKIIALLARGGLESISFERGVTGGEVAALAGILGDPGTYTDPEGIRKALEEAGAARVRLNYVQLKQVRADQEVVGRDEAEEPSRTGAPDGAAREALDNVGMAMDEQERRGEAEAAGHGQSRAEIIDRIRRLNSKIQSGEGAEVSSEQLMNAVAQLREEMSRSRSVHEEMSGILQQDPEALDEMSSLTYETIVRLAREEYAQGTIAVKRLANTIRRLLPDVRELKRLLPVLKKGLLADGMSLEEFLQLTRELGKELRSDGALEALQDSAEEMGLSPAELAESIKQNPGEAARLLMLASELQRGTSGDDTRLSSMLTEYIEKVSNSMALNSPDSDEAKNPGALGDVLHRVETELVDKLREQGVSQSVSAGVERELSKGFEHRLQDVQTRRLRQSLEARPDMPPATIAGILTGILGEDADVESRSALMTEVGLDKDRIEAVRKLLEKGPEEPRLPKGVLRTANLVFFLKRQIAMCLRYDNPFSVLMITVPRVHIKGREQPADQHLRMRIHPEIYSRLMETLRELDLVGSLGKLQHDIPFVILPMTGEEGAEVVKKRLETTLAGMELPYESFTVCPEVVVSFTAFDPLITRELETFVKLVRDNHKAEEKKRGRNAV